MGHFILGVILKRISWGEFRGLTNINGYLGEEMGVKGESWQVKNVTN